MITTQTRLRSRLKQLLSVGLLAVLVWTAPLIDPTAQARDPQQATQAAQDEPHSRWDGLELWAQRKRPTRAQRRRAAQTRRARARKAQQEKVSAEESDGTESENQDEDAAADSAQAGSTSALEHKLGAGQSLQRSNEMQFDDRLIRGEKAGSGAVILFDRRARRLPRLTRDRRNFFQQTVRAVLGKREN